MTICDRYETDGTLARYVARELGDDAAASFEDHFLTCERCQRSIEIGSLVRATPPTPMHRRSPLPAALLLTAAAAAAIFIGMRGMQRANVRGMGAVGTAPIYLGAAMRGAATDPAQQFEAAMSDYSAGRYSSASNKLAEIERVSSEPAVAFFRGASLLMERDARGAEAEFSKVLNSGDDLYRGEAFFYRAKARLQLSDRAGAIADLRAAAKAGTMQKAANDLLKQLSD